MKKEVKELLKEAYNSEDVCQEWRDKIKEVYPRVDDISHLIKEADKRGFRKGVKVRSHQGEFILGDIEYKTSKWNKGIWTYDNKKDRGVWVMFEDVWSEIVEETITKEEAEKQLGKTII